MHDVSVTNDCPQDNEGECLEETTQMFKAMSFEAERVSCLYVYRNIRMIQAYLGGYLQAVGTRCTNGVRRRHFSCGAFVLLIETHGRVRKSSESPRIQEQAERNAHNYSGLFRDDCSVEPCQGSPLGCHVSKPNGGF